jgi:hypothetical protein
MPFGAVKRIGMYGIRKRLQPHRVLSLDRGTYMFFQHLQTDLANTNEAFPVDCCPCKEEINRKEKIKFIIR